MFEIMEIRQDGSQVILYRGNGETLEFVIDKGIGCFVDDDERLSFYSVNED